MKKIKFIIIGIMLILAGLLSACGRTKSYTIMGDYMVYDTAESLVEASDFVFSGTVVNISYEMLDVRTEQGVDSMTGLAETEPLPYTLYEIEITEKYKGTYDTDHIILKRPGGVFDDATYKVADATEILSNESYLFVAAEFPNSYPSLLNATQASYNLNKPDVASNENTITVSQILEIFKK